MAAAGTVIYGGPPPRLKVTCRSRDEEVNPSLRLLSSSLTESPFKVVLEQVSGVEPAEEKNEDDEAAAEEEEMMEGEESSSRLAVLQRPLDICLKHSTVSTPEGTTCPLVQPQLGVSALHEYAQWICKLQPKAEGDGE